MDKNKPQHHQINLPTGFLSPVALELFDVLNTNGTQSLFVGGCVRDAVLGEVAHDIDLATPLTPDETTAALKTAGFKVEPTGLSHGTVMAIKDGEAYEVTTLRKDISTDGRHAEVAFTDDFREDAARRDFTFNAMYMDKTGQVTDYFGGLEDLKNGRLRFVGEPATRLKEDWLRALRFIRFYGRFATRKPEAGTLSALKAAAPELTSLSAERITTEVFKTALTRYPAQAFYLMQDLGYWDALGLGGFSVAGFEKYINAFPASDDALALMVAGLWQADPGVLIKTTHLRLSNQQKKRVRALCPENITRLDPDNVPYSCWLMSADNAVALWRLESVFGPNKAAAKAAFKKAEAIEVPPFPLGGEDLARLGYEKGPAMGAALKKTEAWWAESGFPDKQKCLAYVQDNTP